ncbi:MAG: hypothetical protein CMD08_01565 [Flavobacteriales bacterium]|nr:hypothetical protein [Flavobacteriales bacterium]|tara:strand:+ start:222 stop:776 length:555 start_codon:yes stop_codon:yes gene_type:complete
MSKNSFKKSIQERYKGRGNSWVKVNSDQEGYDDIINHLKKFGDDSKEYISHIERESFAWIRFSKVEGDANNPLVRYEVRFKGSKVDQPESFLIFKHSLTETFDLLGNTPVKLQLEVLPANRKQTSSKVIRNSNTSGSTKNEEDIIDLEKEVRIIKEAALTKPTDRELENWYEFLKVNNLYEDNV